MSIIRSCEEGSFEMEEVDSSERSRTMMTKNTCWDLALGSRPPFEFFRPGSAQEKLEGNKEAQRTVCGSGRVCSQRCVR